MELDEFKIINRQRTVNVWKQHVSDEKEMNIRQEAHSIIGKIKKSLLLEMVLAAFFVLLISFVIFRLANIYLEMFAFITTVICLCFTLYTAQLYRNIVNYQSIVISVKRNLERVINILEKFTRLYFILTLIMVPLILIAAILFGYASIKAITRTPLNTYSADQLSIMAALCLTWYIATYFFTKWYIRKLYGHYLDSLKAQLKELEDA